MDDQFKRGLGKIQDRIREEIWEKRVHGAAASHTLRGSAPCPVTFKVVANGKTSEQTFTREEIEDSADSIEHGALYKVNELLGRL